MSWPGEKQRHSLSARGISTSLISRITNEPQKTKNHFEFVINHLKHLENKYKVEFIDFDILSFKIEDGVGLGHMSGTLKYKNEIYDNVCVHTIQRKADITIGFHAVSNDEIKETNMEYNFKDFLSIIGKWNMMSSRGVREQRQRRQSEKYFDNLAYKRHTFVTRKSEAEKIKQGLKQKGYLVRVVSKTNRVGIKGYCIYRRVK